MHFDYQKGVKFRKQALNEYKSKTAWWQDEKPRQELPEELEKLLANNDPKFIGEMKKVAITFSNQYQWNSRKNQYEWKGWDYIAKKDGSWLWTLYNKKEPLAKQALRELLGYVSYDELKQLSKGITGEGNYWYWYGDCQTTFIWNWQTRYSLVKFSKRFYRYLKAIYKSAERKRDASIWSILAYRFDIEKRYHLRHQYYWYNRNNDENQIGDTYSPKTHRYLQRRSWRTLRNLGKSGSEDYVKLATELLLCYQANDGKMEKLDSGEDIHTFQRYWLFNHVLYHHSSRFTYTGETWRASESAYIEDLPQKREEAFPELWDQNPDALLRFVQEAEANPVILFATRALRMGNPAYLAQLPNLFFESLLTSQNSVRRAFAAEELLERLDKDHPDFQLWLSFSFSPYIELRTKARDFLQNYMDRWSQEQLGILIKTFMRKIQSDQHIAKAIIHDWVDILTHELAEHLSQVTTMELMKKLLEIENVELERLVAMMLTKVDFSLQPYTGASLLPFLQSKSVMVRPAARQLLLERFTQLQLDAPFIVELALIPDEDNQVFTTQFLTNHILWLVPMMPELLQMLWVRMTRSEIPEMARDYIRDDLLGSLFFQELSSTPLDKVLRLLDSDSTQLQEFGARLLKLIQPQANLLTFEQLLDLAHCRIAAAREEARNLIIQVIDQVQEDWLVNLVETDWDDTRNWVFGYLHTLSSEQFTPSLIYGLLDTARTDVQRFAMELVKIHERDLDLKELILRASESPDLVVQEYALTLADQVNWDLEMIKGLAPYFRTILFRVHAGRKAKQMALPLLLELAERSREMAEVIIPILTDVARNGVKRDFELILMTLTRIHIHYPEIQTPILID